MGESVRRRGTAHTVRRIVEAVAETWEGFSSYSSSSELTPRSPARVARSLVSGGHWAEALGIERYDSYLADGHSEYFGQGGHRVVSPAVHEVLPVAETGQREMFLQHLRRHERRETTYLEMSRGKNRNPKLGRLRSATGLAFANFPANCVCLLGLPRSSHEDSPIAAACLACGLHCGVDSTYGDRTDRARQKAVASSRSGRPSYQAEPLRPRS